MGTGILAQVWFSFPDYLALVFIFSPAVCRVFLYKRAIEVRSLGRKSCFKPESVQGPKERPCSRAVGLSSSVWEISNWSSSVVLRGVEAS